MKVYFQNPADAEAFIERNTNLGGRIDTIEKYMREHRQSYNKDESMQAELRDLYSQREGE